MSVEQRASAADRVLATREQYVARGVSTPALVVARAEGARVWDVDGREYLDFAGGIACQNLGHGPSAVVAAVHEQVDRYLHQCFMVGTYEPYVELCRRLDELWPGDDGHQVDPRQLRCRGDRERRQDRPRRDRPGRRRRLRPRIPRPHEPDDGDDGEARLQAGLRPARDRRLPRRRAVPFRGISTEDALASLDLLFDRTSPRSVACIVLEPVQGEGGFIPCRRSSCRRCAGSATSTGSSRSTTRCRAAAGAPAPSGRSSSSASSRISSSRARRWAAASRSRRSPAAQS